MSVYLGNTLLAGSISDVSSFATKTELNTGLTGKANTDASNFTSEGKSTISKFVMPEINFLTCSGKIADSPTSNFAGVGIATVTLLPNRLARIDFTIKITDTGGSEFIYGLSASLLHLLNPNIPLITPVAVGICSYYKITGEYSDDFAGYGGVVVPVDIDNIHWNFGRVYTTSGNCGSWPASQFSVNHKIVGTCYGTY